MLLGERWCWEREREMVLGERWCWESDGVGREMVLGEIVLGERERCCW